MRQRKNVVAARKKGREAARESKRLAAGLCLEPGTRRLEALRARGVHADAVGRAHLHHALASGRWAAKASRRPVALGTGVQVRGRQVGGAVELFCAVLLCIRGTCRL